MDDRLDIGGSSGLDNSNMDKSSSVCGYSDAPGELAFHTIIYYLLKYFIFHRRTSTSTLLWDYICEIGIKWQVLEPSNSWNTKGARGRCGPSHSCLPRLNEPHKQRMSIKAVLNCLSVYADSIRNFPSIQTEILNSCKYFTANGETYRLKL